MHTSYILQGSFWHMVQLNSCRVCGREFESDEELNKHEPRCAFSRKNYYLQK